MEGGEFPQPKHILRRLADKLTGRKAPEQPEKAEELERFILQGLELIKSGQYSAAIRYLESQEQADGVGIHYASDPTSVFIQQLPIPNPKALEKTTDDIAQHCHFYQPGNKKESPMIKLPPVIIDINPQDPKGPYSLAGEDLPDSLGSQIPVSLYHNTALSYAEEWLHALQFFRGNEPIADYKNTEIDVAAYLLNQGVPLTDEFLERYQRKAVLFEGKPPPPIPMA